MQLAKNAIDLGLSTNNLEPMLRFWHQDAGLRLDHVLPVRRGQKQYRHDALGSVIKLNHHAEPLPAAAPERLPRTHYCERGRRETPRHGRPRWQSCPPGAAGRKAADQTCPMIAFAPHVTAEGADESSRGSYRKGTEALYAQFLDHMARSRTANGESSDQEAKILLFWPVTIVCGTAISLTTDTGIR
jgi:hypothetical protein